MLRFNALQRALKRVKRVQTQCNATQRAAVVKIDFYRFAICKHLRIEATV